MQTNPNSADDLSELERKLAGWRPSTAGLDADRMLFAAGRNSVRPGWGRNASLIAAGCLTLLSAILGRARARTCGTISICCPTPRPAATAYA